MANTHNTLGDLFTAIANSIRNKTKKLDKIIADNFPNEIDNLQTSTDYFNDKVTEVPPYMFYGLDSINSVCLPNATELHNQAFDKCSNLKYVALRNSNITFGQNVFPQNEDFVLYGIDGSDSEDYAINNNITFIPMEIYNISGGSGNIRGNYLSPINVLYIVGEGNMKNFPYSNFSADYPWDETLSKVVIGEGLTNIGDYAFYDCRSLTTVNIPEGVVSIGTNAFHNCRSLTSINIPNSVTAIGWGAFSYCLNIKSLFITDIEQWCNINFAQASSPLSVPGNLYLNDSLVTNLDIPETITVLQNHVFENCASLINVKIPNTVTSIGTRAFDGCNSLETINIPSSVNYMDDSVFFNCRSLKNINISNGIVKMGTNTFRQCKSLTDIIIPDSVTDIGSSSFYLCESLKNITLSNNLTQINSETFRGCKSLTDIVIPDSVISIGDYAFDGCESLETIIIPNNVTTIGSDAFWRCSALTTITLPTSLTNIGSGAFSTGFHLTTINYAGTTSQWNAITFGTDWDGGTGNYTIYCTDGTISKDGTITNS